MECRLCGHPSTHKHGKAPNGSQRYACPHCKQTVTPSYLYLGSYTNSRKRLQKFRVNAQIEML